MRFVSKRNETKRNTIDLNRAVLRRMAVPIIRGKVQRKRVALSLEVRSPRSNFHDGASRNSCCRGGVDEFRRLEAAVDGGALSEEVIPDSAWRHNRDGDGQHGNGAGANVPR